VDQEVLPGRRGGDGYLGVNRVRHGYQDGVDVVALDRVFPALDDVAAAPLVTEGFGRRMRPARERTDSRALGAQRRKVDLTRRVAATDNGESHAHVSSRHATLRTALATSSQARSSYPT